MEKYPALAHTTALFKQIVLDYGSAPARHWIVLRGEDIKSRHDTDTELRFEQESNFYWLSGCAVPGSALVASYDDHGMWDSSRVRCEVFLPEESPDDVMWSGAGPTADAVAATTNVSNVTKGYSVADLTPHDSPLKVVVHMLEREGVPRFPIQGGIQESEFLIHALHVCRRTKDLYEEHIMAEANRITAAAHIEIMSLAGQGKLHSEADVEAAFVSKTRQLGSKGLAYLPIAAASGHAGTLHYIANDEPFSETRKKSSGSKGGFVVLVDMGCQFARYTSDITRTIPIGNGGHFTKECRHIYEAVLHMQTEALSRIRPGADWEEIQRFMHTLVARRFLKLGLFVTPASTAGATSASNADADAVAADAAREIVRSGLTTAFFPHGLGHLLGLDTHDVGGLPDGRSTDPLLRYLRLRVPLQERFILTVEPGIYFNEHLLAPFRGSPYLNEPLLAQYWYVGGVRIEDNVIVTEDGCTPLSNIPKSVADVEKLTSQ